MKKKLSDKETKIAFIIRDFFEKDETLKDCGINDISCNKLWVFNPTVSIKLSRPGILIGKKGTHIEKINKNIDTYFKEHVKIKIIEDRLKNVIDFCLFFKDDY